MSTSTDSIKAFTDEIKIMAAEECEKINKETRQIKTQRIKKANEDAQSRYADYVSYEIKRILSEKNRKISLAEEESRKSLAALRKELTDKVFEKVSADLTEFTKTEDYKNLLAGFVKEIFEDLPEDDNIEFFVRSEDLNLQKDISECIGKSVKFSVSDDVKIGGIKAVSHSTGCLFDNTFDIKLSEQRAWFVENSGLKI